MMTTAEFDLAEWEERCQQFLRETAGPTDPAHDRAHIRRVVANARWLAELERAALPIVIPAAWLHDCVQVAKDSPLRSQASRMAAETGVAFLRGAGYPENYLSAIEHAIAAHSFSARIPTRTLEAQVVQDADRLDALGAIGIARTLMLGGVQAKPLYDEVEPLPLHRRPDDSQNVIDHFYVKLLTLADTMNTDHGRREAQSRTAFMRAYLAQLEQEINDTKRQASDVDA